jgi:hypothetical protein
MRFQDVARFEFRRFGVDLTRFKTSFATMGQPTEQPPDSQTYIVTPHNLAANVKIRSHHLQVKGLDCLLRGMERWVPMMDSAFPVVVQEINDIVAPALGVDFDLSPRSPLSENDWLAVVRAKPQLATVAIKKRRTTYDVGECSAEYCDLEIADAMLQTIAVESEDPEALRSFLWAIGLDSLQNESYPAFLQSRLFPPGF